MSTMPALPWHNLPPSEKQLGIWGLEPFTYDSVSGAAFGYPLPTHAPTMFYVHSPSRCAGSFCSIHNPSDHALATAPRHWQQRGNQTFRRCEHEYLHLDPDDVAFHESQGQGYLLPQDCDGCCGGVCSGD